MGFNGDTPDQPIQCIKEKEYQELYYQGFFGLTSENVKYTKNDIDLTMVEFYNLNPNHYQNTEGLQERNYFEKEREKQRFIDKKNRELKSKRKEQEKEKGIESSSTNDEVPNEHKDKLNVNEMAEHAHDILHMKREVEAQEKEEIKNDLSNINEQDSFDEIVFKLFEQLKSYNNALKQMQKYQNDMREDLEDVER